jgi:hypothetical protein
MLLVSMVGGLTDLMGMDVAQPLRNNTNISPNMKMK